MDAFPLQKNLIDAVIGFANADLNPPDNVRRYFSETWEPDQIPKLRTCRIIQADVRLGLMVAAGFPANRECHDAMRGLEWNFDDTFTRIDPGIRLEGHLSVEKTAVLGGYEEQIVWKWRVTNASLRAICGLAVGTIIQEGLHRKIGLCEREGCSNLFLDRNSRGIPRKYCKTDECEKKLNRQRVSDSRSSKAPRRERK